MLKCIFFHHSEKNRLDHISDSQPEKGKRNKGKEREKKSERRNVSRNP